jgi:biotin synthase
MELEQVLNNPELSKEEIIYLLKLSDLNSVNRLFKKADEVRKSFCGDAVHLRGIIEISNYCEQDCLYCGIRKGNDALERYRMQPEEIIETAKIISNIGIGTIVLQSGEDFEFDTDKIAYIIYSIKQVSDVAITLSLGEREFEEYKTWKYAGADRYLLKHETANPKLYSLYHHKQDINERIRHIEFLKSIGFQAGSGNLIGLPRQTVEDIADDLLLCKNLEVDMASFSPFVPAPNTPYWKKPMGNVEMTLKTVAVGRILLKNSHIPATTALATIDPSGREKALKVGANVIMPNFTPKFYHDKYKIYPKKQGMFDDPVNSSDQIQKLLSSLGRKISWNRGDSLKQNSDLSRIN